MRTKNVPQQQDALSVSGGKIWTEVADKRKSSTDVGDELETGGEIQTPPKDRPREVSEEQ